VQKNNHPKDPMIGANGGLNNKQITLKGLVMKEKSELWGIKGTEERFKLKQMLTYST
jgi:hypothetical protein